MKKKIFIAMLVMAAILSGCEDKNTEKNSDINVQDNPTPIEKVSGNPELSDTVNDQNIETEPVKTVLEKSGFTNPIASMDDSGAYIYGGDPTVLVDGDTVYIYTGHDVSTDEEVSKATYNIPEYLCYSSKDLVNWTKEGVVMTMDTVSWANDDKSAWASQVARHHDAESDSDKYYLYFCTWAKGGKQSIGVAVSDSPKGPFIDIGQPIVHGSKTKPHTSNWNDIDPTVWIETDENGEEHIYLAWGNGIFFMCELNSDMISVKDMNGDGEITCGKDFKSADIVANLKGLDSYTEAPWLYRRLDENGNYYGDYYLFYAWSWREGWAYSITDSLINGEWTFKSTVMPPNATSNTNHMGIFDFKGKTYAVYHNGSLPGGNGYRRSTCLMEIDFNDDGSVKPFVETASGLGGTTVEILSYDNTHISHSSYMNSYADSDYPILLSLNSEDTDDILDEKWVICKGKASPDDENAVSIQSENKPGLFFTVHDGKVDITQDADASEATAKSQTFITYSGLNGAPDTVSFESVSEPGKYITVSGGNLILTDGMDKNNATFTIIY